MQARIELAPEATSPRLARQLTTTLLNHWGFGDAVDVAVLLVDELVTNALLHAGTPIEVALIEQGPVVRVVVSDRNGAIPRPRVHSVGAATGRGLELVALLASDWGAEPTPTGKQVWFEIAAGAGEIGGEGRHHAGRIDEAGLLG